MKTALAALFCAGIALAPAMGAGGRYPVQRVEPLVHGGPFGGRILSLAADPKDANVLYAGTDVGLFRSANGGVSWSLTPVGRDYLTPVSGLYGDSVDGVTVTEADSSVVFASVGTYSRLGLPGHGQTWILFRSADSGRTWQVVLTAAITPFSVAASAGFVYANQDGQFVRSMDNGSTFAQLPLMSVQSVAADPVALATVYATVYSSTQPYPLVDVQKSTDTGNHWEALPLSGASVSRLHVDPSRHLTVYAEGNEFYRSDDGGAHWTGNLWPLPEPIAAFAIGTGDRLFAALPGGDVYESENRGDTWSRVGGVPGGVLSLAAAGDALLAGADGRGVLRSDDRGASWSSRSQGIDAASVDAIAVAPSSPGTAYALAGGFARTTDGGRTWSVDPFAPTAFATAFPPIFAGKPFVGAVAVDPADRSIVYASDSVAGVRRSADGGVTWSRASSTPRFVTSIAMSQVHATTLFMADGQLWKSVDGGSSWNVVGGMPDGAYLVAADPATQGLLYAATPDLYRSEDDGETWSLATSFPLVPGIFQVVPDPSHPGTVYVLSNGLGKSVDRGATWAGVNPAFPSLPIAIAVDGGALSVGTVSLFADGVPVPGDAIRSVDGGSTWHSIASVNTEVGPVGFVTAMTADAEGRVYIGLESNGIWLAAGRVPSTPPPR